MVRDLPWIDLPGFTAGLDVPILRQTGSCMRGIEPVNCKPLQLLTVCRTHMENEQRRSTRIMFSIPLTVSGVDGDGKPFQSTGRTVTLNRHGARLQVSCRLEPGQTVHVINQANGAEADFLVIGPLAPPLDRGGEWGIACLEMDNNIWDIHFPPSPEDSDAHMVLECRHCQTLALHSLSLVEVEVLETAGLLTKPCTYCGESTPWGYPQQVFDEDTQTFQAAVTAASGGAPHVTAGQRKSFRKPAQLPVRVRDYFGEVEMTQTENVSHDGFCFSSLRKYHVGQALVVICPFDAANEKPEARARIVRIETRSGPDRHIYGVRYEPARF